MKFSNLVLGAVTAQFAVGFTPLPPVELVQIVPSAPSVMIASTTSGVDIDKTILKGLEKETKAAEKEARRDERKARYEQSREAFFDYEAKTAAETEARIEKAEQKALAEAKKDKEQAEKLKEMEAKAEKEIALATTKEEKELFKKQAKVSIH